MPALRRARKRQHHVADGRAAALINAATVDYPPWPADLVDLARGAAKDRAQLWYDQLIRHRAPEGWMPGDNARIAMLCKLLVAWERECSLLAERQGDGDAKLADWHQRGIAMLSRQLGFSRTTRDSVTAAGDAMVHLEAVRHETETRGLDLISRTTRITQTTTP